MARNAVSSGAFTSADVLLFRREKDADFPTSELTLWDTDAGYYVSNIVPIETGSLTFAQYNAILEDFIRHVAEPVAASCGYAIEATKPRQTLDDWLSHLAAARLRAFSHLANKSSGASHPSDEKRWFDFIIAVHRARDKLDATRLARWLHEAEGWDKGLCARARWRLRDISRTSKALRRALRRAMDANAIASAGVPVLCIDTCSILDVMRDPTRESAKVHERQAAIDLVAAAEAGKLACLMAEQVAIEFAAYDQPVQDEATRNLNKIREQIER